MKKTIHDSFREVMAEPFAVKHRKILRAEDYIFIGHFLEQTENDDPHTRAMKINRLYIDKPNKTKTWVWISEALTWANSRQLREMIEEMEAGILGEFRINGDSPRLQRLRADLAKLTGGK